MARKIDLLKELQDIDTQLDQFRGELAQVRLEIGERSALDRRTEEVASARTRLARLETDQRDLELQAEVHRAKIAADEKRLYGGTVTNPKELEALNHDVAQARRQLSPLEDRILELFDQTDEAARLRSGLEATLNRETAEWNQRQTQAHQRTEQLEGLVASTETRREAVASQIDGPTRSLYDRLRQQKGGTAVALVLQRTCQACRVGLTPAIEQRSRIGAEIVTCQSCGRILFIPVS